MALNVTQKLIQDHLVSGEMKPGEEIALRIDQTLTQDATGTMVMLELEAMDLDYVKTEVSAQYVDHNLIQVDHKNPDDHLFLESAAKKFGLYFSRAGNGVSHPVHMQRLAIPGKSLLGSDSHTCANGCMGMLAIGAGGIDVAMAMAGEPFYVTMPEILGVKLVGELPEWVSAKDVILEMLRRYDVKGGVGKIIEYYGPGLNHLSAMDRHVIANMGAELGATTTVFPSDDEVRKYLKNQDREDDWVKIVADEGATYDLEDEIDLSTLEPLVAKPTSPGNVVPVSEIEGTPIYQSYIGSSANPGYRDFAIAAEIVKDQQIAHGVSFDINPTSRQMLMQLVEAQHVASLLQSGARLHQAGCNGCIGMGQAPASGRNSLRTTPRNFPGRSGTPEDSVFLSGPETAAASALTGVITDPRKLKITHPNIKEPRKLKKGLDLLDSPLPYDEAQNVSLTKGENIVAIPDMDALPNELKVPVLLKLEDNISTDEILAGGARVLPFRSNLPKISEFTFEGVDSTYVSRAKEVKDQGGHAIVAGFNYGQGSSREHAVLAPRYLGLQVVLVKDYARIHLQNLINFGVLPLMFKHEQDYENIQKGDILQASNVRKMFRDDEYIEFTNERTGDVIQTTYHLTDRHKEMIIHGGVINFMKSRQS